MNKPADLPTPVAVSGRQKMTPSEAFVETLVAQGVKTVFGIVGSAYMDALDLFPLAGIRFISVAHGHGVCIAQHGPGITNYVTSVAAAYWAHSPVVCITPETGSMTLGLGGFQETDQLPIFSRITKYQAHVNNKARMAELTARAFDRAHLELGPTQLNIPRDFFYGDIECEIPRPMTIERGAGGEKSLDEAAALLASAKFPVILAGGGVIMANGQPEAIALAEALQAPVAVSYLHNDAFPAKHPLWCGPLGYQGSKAAMKLIGQADVVLALGTRLGPFGTLPQYGIDYWPKQAKIIQVDADPKMLGLVKTISVGICGDAKAAAVALAARLEGRTLASHANQADRLAKVKAEKAAWEAELETWTREKDPWSLEVTKDSPYMHPRQMLRELERAMPEGAMVSTKVAAPDRPAIAYVGDGAWGMSFGELQTCVREAIPVTAVVFNNGQWGAEKKNHVDFYANRFLGVNLDKQPSWAAVAKAMGAEGLRIEKLSDVGPALRAAAAAQKDGRTTVLEMMVTRELGDPFRRDALAMPTRHLAKYKSTEAKR